MKLSFPCILVDRKSGETTLLSEEFFENPRNIDALFHQKMVIFGSDAFPYMDYPWKLIDFYGREVLKRDLKKMSLNLYQEGFLNKFYKTYKIFSFRNGPVPGTSSKPYKVRIRKPKSGSELNDVHSCIYKEIFDEYGIDVKKREVKKIPSSWFWDMDFYCSRTEVRNWKKYRKHQWKEKKPS